MIIQEIIAIIIVGGLLFWIFGNMRYWNGYRDGFFDGIKAKENKVDEIETQE